MRWKQRYNLGAISQESEEMQIEALKREAYELKKCVAKNIISAVIVEQTTPHLCDFVPLTKREIYRRA